MLLPEHIRGLLSWSTLCFTLHFSKAKTRVHNSTGPSLLPESPSPCQNCKDFCCLDRSPWVGYDPSQIKRNEEPPEGRDLGKHPIDGVRRGSKLRSKQCYLAAQSSSIQVESGSKAIWNHCKQPFCSHGRLEILSSSARNSTESEG